MGNGIDFSIEAVTTAFAKFATVVQ